MKYIMGIVLIISAIIFLTGHGEITQTRIGMIYLWLAWIMFYKKDDRK